MRVWAVMILFITVGRSEKKRYDGYQVISLLPSSPQDIRAISSLSRDFDIWKKPRGLNRWSDVLVPPYKVFMFKKFLRHSGIAHKIKNANIQRTIDSEEETLKAREGYMNWNAYHRLNAIYEWLDDLASNYSNVHTVVVGRTFEGRLIKGLEIEFGSDLEGVFIEAGAHAREWISPASTTWIINYILTSPVDSIFRQFNYHYFPVANPDGYDYSWTRDRLWRKTRRPYKTDEGVICYGADPNRNWGFRWGGEGSSDFPCSEVYCGPQPFSENSIRALSEYIKWAKETKKIEIFIAFHSYSQLLLFPWGYTLDPAPRKPYWQKIGEAAAAELESISGTKLDYGQSSHMLYLTSGSSDDWFYGTYNASISFTIEMRDRGEYGFVLPPSQIIPNSVEYCSVLRVVLTEYAKGQPPLK